MNKEEKKTTDEKPVEIKKDGAVEGKTAEEKAPLREILIQTNGLDINIVKAEVSILELREICKSILESTYKKQNG